MARYGFEGDKPERLAGIEATWDPGTRALLESIGVGPSWRCLEAGAGGGSIAVWMSERVGPDGSVLATDIDATHLEPLGGGVLEVRRHDLRRDDLPVESFDLVHERSLLSWLGASDALERLVAAVAPGGWLLVEDFDWANGGPGDDAPAVANAYRAIQFLPTSTPGRTPAAHHDPGDARARVDRRSGRSPQRVTTAPVLRSPREPKERQAGHPPLPHSTRAGVSRTRVVA